MFEKAYVQAIILSIISLAYGAKHKIDS